MEHCFFRVAQAITFKINHFQLYKTKQPKYPVNLTVREQDDSEQACIMCKPLYTCWLRYLASVRLFSLHNRTHPDKHVTIYMLNNDGD